MMSLMQIFIMIRITNDANTNLILSNTEKYHGIQKSS